MHKKILYIISLIFFVISCNSLDSVKRGITGEKQKSIEDEIVPAGIFSKPVDEQEYYVEDGDVWTVVENTKIF